MGNWDVSSGITFVSFRKTIFGSDLQILPFRYLFRNLKDDEAVQGSPALSYGDFNKSYVHFKNLPSIVQRVNNLTKDISHDK